MTSSKSRIGVISDTHGLWRDQISDIFKGVDLIIHAGDIGHPAILEELNKIRTTIAICGNIDRGDGRVKPEIIEL